MGTYTVRNHLPILKKAINYFKVESVFEFGIGIHSTGLFLEKCRNIYTVEMNSHIRSDRSWFSFVTEKFGKKKGWKPKEILGKTEAIEYFLNLNKSFDLVFVDGHGDTRAEQANAAIGRAKVIIIHDAQHTHTQNGIKLQKTEYKSAYIEKFAEKEIKSLGDTGPTPSIMILTKDDKFLEHINSHKKQLAQELL